jgi:hypothetical protein
MADVELENAKQWRRRHFQCDEDNDSQVVVRVWFCPWDDVHVKIQNPVGDDREHGDW